MTGVVNTGYVVFPDLVLSALSEFLDGPMVSNVGLACRRWQEWFKKEHNTAIMTIFNHLYEKSDPESFIIQTTKWKSVKQFIEWSRTDEGKYQTRCYRHLQTQTLAIKILPKMKTFFPNLRQIIVKKEDFPNDPKWAVDAKVTIKRV